MDFVSSAGECHADSKDAPDPFYSCRHSSIPCRVWSINITCDNTSYSTEWIGYLRYRGQCSYGAPDKPSTVIHGLGIRLVSLYPFSELYGVPTNPSPSSRSSVLAELLRPTSYRGTYALCMIVSLQLDDPSAFAINGAATPEFQEFTLVPGVTNVSDSQLECHTCHHFWSRLG